MPFSARAIRTRAQYGQRGASTSLQHQRSILWSARSAGRVGPAVLGARQPEGRGERRLELARRRQVGGRGSDGSGRAHRRLRGAGVALDDDRIRVQRDDLARRQRAVELGHRGVLVDDAAAVEEDHPHERFLLDADRDHDEPGAGRDLLREPPEHRRVAVADVVVHGHVAAPGLGHDRAGRAAGKPRHEHLDRLQDRVDVVGLGVDRAERGRDRVRLAEPLGERRDGRREHEHLVAEAPAGVGGAGGGVGRHHLEIDGVDAVCGEARDDLARQRLGDAGPALGGPHVEIGDAAHPGAATLGQDHPHGRAVLLGDPAEPRLDDPADLGELGCVVHDLVGGRRHLGGECTPELLEHGQVVGGRAAHGHPCNLAPASSMWQATLRHCPNRSPTSRTSVSSRSLPEP